MHFVSPEIVPSFNLGRRSHVVQDRAVRWINSVQHLVDSAFYYRQHGFGSRHVWRSHTCMFVHIRSPLRDSVQPNMCDLIAGVVKRFVFRL